VTNETGIWIARGAGVPPFQELSMPSATATKGSPSDAIGLLNADHKDVKKLFESYKKLEGTEAGDDEKGAMFPKVRKTDIDLKALGKEIKTRKAELMEEMAAG
jgi:hypothetical protein